MKPFNVHPLAHYGQDALRSRPGLNIRGIAAAAANQDAHAAFATRVFREPLSVENYVVVTSCNLQMRDNDMEVQNKGLLRSRPIA